jgi:hypothetical protein
MCIPLVLTRYHIFPASSTPYELEGNVLLGLQVDVLPYGPITILPMNRYPYQVFSHLASPRMLNK